jgi:hypothetical protein
MLSRRSILLASIAAGVTMSRKDAFAKAAQPTTPVNFDVPTGACDCHTHIHADPEKFPFFAGRVYTPELASPQEMSELHRALHVERVVIVTPSVYGPDNSTTRFGMMARGATARGVAVIDDKTPESDLDVMQKAGFRGIRLNLATGGVNDPTVGRPRFQAAVERVKARNWHVQLFTSLSMISAIKDLVAASPVRVRPFRRRAGRVRCGPARLCRSAGARKIGQGLRQNLRRLSGIETRARLSRRGAARPRTDRGQFGPHYLGHRLAASEFGGAAGRKADRPDAFVPDRRRPSVQPASGMGAGRSDPQNDSGRQSGAALWVLRAAS